MSLGPPSPNEIPSQWYCHQSPLFCPNIVQEGGVEGMQKARKRWTENDGLPNSVHYFQSQTSSHLLLEASLESRSLPQTTVALRMCHYNCLLTHLYPKLDVSSWRAKSGPVLLTQGCCTYMYGLPQAFRSPRGLECSRNTQGKAFPLGLGLSSLGWVRGIEMLRND